MGLIFLRFFDFRISLFSFSFFWLDQFRYRYIHPRVVSECQGNSSGLELSTDYCHVGRIGGPDFRVFDISWIFRPAEFRNRSRPPARCFRMPGWEFRNYIMYGFWQSLPEFTGRSLLHLRVFRIGPVCGVFNWLVRLCFCCNGHALQVVDTGLGHSLDTWFLGARVHPWGGIS